MCGITGSVSRSHFDVKSMLNAIKHRGPDATGSIEKKISDKNIFLGHQRLSIVDVSSAGHQPMSTGNEKIHIVFNGEIYNFKALRRAHLADYSFNSETDTETILYLYEKYGIDFINDLNGDFSFAILDEFKGKLFLARDRVGVKPLYYFNSGGHFLFASEIKSILASGLTFELDKEQVENFLVFKYQPENNTLIKNIERVPPGHIAELDINSGKLKFTCYWKLKKDKETAALNYNESTDYLKELLTDSVDLQLMADVPIGTFFSGGVDSSIIASLVKDHKEITHYTARKSAEDLKKEGSSSDYDYAIKLGRQWGLDLVAVDIGSDKANLDLIQKTLYYSDDLIADGSQIPSYLITREAVKKSTVMLSGMGADELFYGYPGHQISLLSSYLNKLPGGISKGISSFFSSLEVGKGHFKPYKRFLQKLGKYNHLGASRFGFLNIVGDYNNSVSLLKKHQGSALEIFNSYFLETENTFDAITHFEFNNFLVKNLHYVDRMSMANAVEGRVPFLDYRLVEFAYSIPREYKISHFGTGKRILKDAFSAELPAYLIKRRKAGFGMPFRSIFSERKKINSLLDIRFFSDMDIFSIEHLNKIIDSHINGYEDNSALIYALISFQEWYKIFLNK